jgi:menaquinone-dependent protoporphyrinogen oxidase
MLKILIIFASHYGQTRSIAERIATRLRACGHDVDLVDAAQAPDDLPAPEDYGAVVLGSRIEVGRHAAGVRQYMRAHADDLRELPTAFFSVCMAATNPSAGADPNGYLDTLFKELGWKPTRAVALAGGLPYRKYGWLTRFIMKRISKAAGHTTDTSKNHEFTDWKRVDAFADEIVAMLPAASDPIAVRASDPARG